MVHDILGQCACGNNQPSKFWYLMTNDYELLGICCKRRSCAKEYLIGRFAPRKGTSIFVDNLQLYYNTPDEVELDPEFQVRLAREWVIDVGNLQPGDHVGFDRPYLIWHHAIVVQVQADPFRLIIEEWHGDIDDMRRKTRAVFQNELNYMWKFNYSEAIEERNPPELVIARSNSRLHHEGEESVRAQLWVWEEYEEHYGFLNNNCEHYATYCKTGTPICNQSVWLLGTLQEALASTIIPNLAVELFENIIQELTSNTTSNTLFEGIGLVGVLAVEGISFRAALDRLDIRRTNGDIQEAHYRIELGKRVIELLLVILVGGGGGVALGIAGYKARVEISLAPLLVLAAKAGACTLAHYISDEWPILFADQWQRLQDYVRRIEAKTRVAAQKAANFVQTEVIPLISAAVEYIRNWFSQWLI